MIHISVHSIKRPLIQATRWFCKSSTTIELEKLLSQSGAIDSQARAILNSSNEKLKDNYLHMLKECKKIKRENCIPIDASQLEAALKKAEENFKHSVY